MITFAFLGMNIKCMQYLQYYYYLLRSYGEYDLPNVEYKEHVITLDSGADIGNNIQILLKIGQNINSEKMI